MGNVVIDMSMSLDGYIGRRVRPIRDATYRYRIATPIVTTMTTPATVLGTISATLPAAIPYATHKPNPMSKTTKNEIETPRELCWSTNRRI